jgi:hypothetical protein
VGKKNRREILIVGETFSKKDSGQYDSSKPFSYTPLSLDPDPNARHRHCHYRYSSPFWLVATLTFRSWNGLCNELVGLQKVQKRGQF